MEADEMRDDPLSGNVGGFWYLENEYNSFPLSYCIQVLQ